MADQKHLSSRTMVLLAAISLSAGIIGSLIGGVFGAALRTSPAWVGPAILIASVVLVLVGVLLLPTAIREYKASNR